MPAPGERPGNGEDRDVTVIFTIIAGGFVLGLLFLFVIVASGTL